VDYLLDTPNLTNQKCIRIYRKEDSNDKNMVAIRTGYYIGQRYIAMGSCLNLCNLIVCVIFAVCLKSLVRFKFRPAFNSESFNPRQMLDLATSQTISAWPRDLPTILLTISYYFWTTQQQRSRQSPSALLVLKQFRPRNTPPGAWRTPAIS